MTPIVTTFECVWCRESEEISASLKTDSVHELADLMDEEEYTFPIGEIGGYDARTKQPICDFCADAAAEEMSR